jgi:hypothetical protein
MVEPDPILLDPLAEFFQGAEAAVAQNVLAQYAEGALDWVEPGSVLGGEMQLPAGMALKPVVDVVGVVCRQVVAHEVASSVRIGCISQFKQIAERLGVVVVGDEAEELAPAHVVGAHQAQRAVANILKLTTYGSTRPHGQV